MAFVLDHSVHIDAPAQTVWDVLTDFAAYAEWNPFCLSCEATLAPGAPIDMTVKLIAGREVRQREWIHTVNPGTGFGYSMKPYPAGALRSLRTHTITPQGDGSCRYDSHFEIDGWLRPVVTSIMGPALRSGFAAMTAAVKDRAEQRM
ncbi:SRPBCC domain-containing protein [Nocardia stercoris]|uniref:SRPBCC domain-containing protein n=1 Tax=Nocardia stercoris TaxID=2483361 RepID=A0A3M2L6T1_9NOCA|nr:SRPBCC domain-containing protein [Nocardia stercoris]RMI33341.1 SRPBCC domain-containing protein [Nocardia stercoris]